jgi:hypothetical protein
MPAVATWCLCVSPAVVCHAVTGWGGFKSCIRPVCLYVIGLFFFNNIEGGVRVGGVAGVVRWGCLCVAGVVWVGGWVGG